MTKITINTDSGPGDGLVMEGDFTINLTGEVQLITSKGHPVVEVLVEGQVVASICPKETKEDD